MNTIKRRQFLAATALAAASASSLVQGAADSPKLKIGLIGCGWYGMVDVEAAFKVGGVEVVAVCDADTKNLKESADKIEKRQGSRPKMFKHYQELLETAGLQAVIIATPPHWHALQFIAALEKNLDIYCEKPLAYDIREGEAMAAAAKGKKCIVQIGFQRRQSQAIQQARDYIQSGAPGKIVQAEVQIFYTAGLRDTTIQEPPASLDWDQWCGPAPKLPYCPQIGHFAWRLEKEYGNGHLVDWGIHLIDATRMILGETMPLGVTAAGGIYQFKGKITTPDILMAHFDFAKCPVIWRHHIWGAAEYSPEVENGIFFYGEKETVFVTDNKWIVIPRDRKANRKVNDVNTDAGTRHMEDWLKAVQSRQQPSCLIDDAFCSTAAVQLAMLSYQTGAKVTWDAQKRQVVENPAAAKLLKREYRAPWQHPYKS